MIYRQVLDHCFGALLAQPKILRLATRRIRMAGNFDHIRLRVSSFLSQSIELLFALWR